MDVPCQGLKMVFLADFLRKTAWKQHKTTRIPSWILCEPHLAMIILANSKPPIWSSVAATSAMGKWAPWRRMQIWQVLNNNPMALRLWYFTISLVTKKRFTMMYSYMKLLKEMVCRISLRDRCVIHCICSTFNAWHMNIKVTHIQIHIRTSANKLTVHAP